MKTLAGKVSIVTGATRGIGKGVALQLGEAGSTVYITGRTLNPVDGGTGSLKETAEEIEKRGGKCIPIQCDHSKDEDVKKLFDRVKREQDGRLDILVNNAYSGVHTIFNNLNKKFWEVDGGMWDDINNIGLRNHYLCSVFASRMMAEKKSGLIVNVSSMGGLRYIFNVPYGIGKAGCDRMAADCAQELKEYGVTFISLWPGAVDTENIMKFKETSQLSHYAKLFNNSETIEYAGKCIVHLASDPNILKKTGKILLTSDLGDEYNFDDINGVHRPSIRQVSELLKFTGHKWLASWIPGFVKIPGWMLWLTSNKL